MSIYLIAFFVVLFCVWSSFLVWILMRMDSRINSLCDGVGESEGAEDTGGGCGLGLQAFSGHVVPGEKFSARELVAMGLHMIAEADDKGGDSGSASGAVDNK